MSNNNMNIKIDGLDSLEKQLEFALRAIIQGSEKAGEDIGKIVQKEVKENIVAMGAVDTGELLNSITYEVDNDHSVGTEITITANAEHAKYVEFGTGVVGHENPSHFHSKYKKLKYDRSTYGNFPRPFMTRAYYGSYDKVMARLKSKIQKEMRDIRSFN